MSYGDFISMSYGDSIRFLHLFHMSLTFSCNVRDLISVLSSIPFFSGRKEPVESCVCTLTKRLVPPCGPQR